MYEYLVTPEDYEPPGFKAADCDSLSFDVNPVKIGVGSVSTVSDVICCID